MAIHATIEIQDEQHHFGVGVNDIGGDEPKFSQVPLMGYSYDPPGKVRQERQVLGGKPKRYTTGDGLARLTLRGRYGAPTAGPSTRLIVLLELAQRNGWEVQFSLFPKELVETAWLVERFDNPCSRMENGQPVDYTYTLTLVEA